MEEWCDMQGVRKLPEGYVKDNNWAVPSDQQLRCNVLLQYNDSPTAGHPGRDNMITLVTRKYWWCNWPGVMVQPIVPLVSSGTGHGLIIECFMCIRALAHTGLTVLMCHVLPF